MSKPFSQQPAAFMSYVRLDDQHESGRLTQLRERLSGEVRMQSGEAFDIFQDRNDIAWGQQWKQRIDESLDAVTFLIPIITPAFFKSPACREELERFLLREADLGRTDLILPVYYVESATLSDGARRAQDHLAAAIASRQYADFRELRFEPFTSPQIAKALAAMARQIVEALDRGQPQSARAAAQGSASSTVRPAATPAVPPHDGSPAATAEPARGPVSKTEAPTLVVDALHRGDHATLTGAIAAAKPGTRILVRPGLYREGVLIEKPLEIIGDGDLADVVLEATGKNAVLFRADMGRIANLTLRQAGGGRWFCIDIAQGRLDVDGCDITSQSLACVGIHGGADPRLRRNRIHDGKQAGVYVYENSLGTLEDNEIFANALSGVVVTTGANPTVRRNRIHDGKAGGVYVYENGQGTLEDNEIFANGLAGVEIKTGGNPTLRRNRIHDGKVSGVYVYENGHGTLEDNEIFANALSGVEIKTGGNPTLRRNRIYDGKQAGVYVYDNGQGALEDNEIFGNAFAGVAIKTGGNPVLRRNRIHDGKVSGVYVYENGQGTLEDNDIFANALSGVEIKAGGNPTLRRNRIRDGRGTGLFVLENGQGTLEDNEIVANARAGVEITTGGNPTLRRNRISKNTYEAIWVHNGGGGTFEANDLRGNKRGPWDVEPGSKAGVRQANNIES